MESVARSSVRLAVVTWDREALLLHAVLPSEDWWELPGGGIEAGENPVDAAIRELREETGIEITTTPMRIGIVDTEFVWNDRLYLQTEEVFAVRVADRFEVTLGFPDPPPAARHVEFRWWTTGQLGEATVPIHPPQLPALLAELP